MKNTMLIASAIIAATSLSATAGDLFSWNTSLNDTGYYTADISTGESSLSVYTSESSILFAYSKQNYQGECSQVGFVGKEMLYVRDYPLHASVYCDAVGQSIYLINANDSIGELTRRAISESEMAGGNVIAFSTKNGDAKPDVFYIKGFMAIYERLMTPKKYASN